MIETGWFQWQRSDWGQIGVPHSFLQFVQLVCEWKPDRKISWWVPELHPKLMWKHLQRVSKLYCHRDLICSLAKWTSSQNYSRQKKPVFLPEFRLSVSSLWQTHWGAVFTLFAQRKKKAADFRSTLLCHFCSYFGDTIWPQSSSDTQRKQAHLAGAQVLRQCMLRRESSQC